MGASNTKPIRDILASVSVDTDVLYSNFGDIVQIDSRSNLPDAYQKLLDHNILTAPVWDHVSQQYIGMLDLRDLVSFAVYLYENEYQGMQASMDEFDKENALRKVSLTPQTTKQENEKGDEKDEGKTPPMPEGQVKSILQRVDGLGDSDYKDSEETGNKVHTLVNFFEKVKERQQRVLRDLSSKIEKRQQLEKQSFIVCLSRRNSFEYVRNSDTLLRVADILAAGAHSVPVMDEKKRITNMITQSTIVRFLYNWNNNEIKKFLQNPIGKLGTSPVVAVSEKFSVYAACKVLDERFISGVAVIDQTDKNKLIGNFSASDLRRILKSGDLSFEALSMNVVTFLKAPAAQPVAMPHDYVLKRAMHRVGSVKRPAIVTCHPNDTIYTLVKKFYDYKIHRVYITDKDSEGVLAVVCLKDLLRLVVSTDHLTEKKNLPIQTKLYVCDCHHCKGRYSYASQSTVDQHIYRYGRHAPWWTYKLYTPGHLY